MTQDQVKTKKSKIPARLRAQNRHQVHHLKNGSICVSTFGFTVFSYAEAHKEEFAGDMERALEEALDLSNTVEFSAFVDDLYEKDPTYFEQYAPLIVGPYTEPNRVYDPAKRNTFIMQYKRRNIIPAETEHHFEREVWEDAIETIYADRYESAVAIWHNTINVSHDLTPQGYQLVRVMEIDRTKRLLNTWERKTTDSGKTDLVLLTATQH